jgi:glyoxylase-like metal-dependent hydrolase (beta-lactamase superfamily II)
MKKSFFTILLLLLVSFCLFAKGADDTARQSNKNRGFIINDGATYYYTADSKMLTEDYIRNGDNSWYFCKDGRGIVVYYKYLAENLIQIFDYGYDSCFLLIGEDQALWVDAMFGFGNLVKLTKMFTDKPIKGVAVTHSHIDHIGGVFHFDNVYLNQLDWPSNGNGFSGQQARYDDNMTTIRFHKDFGFSIDDYAENVPVNLIHFANGDVIDVGGASIEAIHTPGHSQGMTMFLFREHRILLTGDECNHNTMLSTLSVESYRRVIQGLVDRHKEKNEWDTILISHGQWDEGTEAPKTLLEDMVELCDKIIDGSIIGVRLFGRYRAYPVAPNQMRLDGGFVNLVYEPNNIHDPVVK